VLSKHEPLNASKLLNGVHIAHHQNMYWFLKKLSM